MNLHTLAALLRTYRFPIARESDLQAALETLFTAENIGFTREHCLSKEDRPDFYLPDGRIAIEAKIHGGIPSVIKQCRRYAEHETVDGVLLVTKRAVHRIAEKTLAGKPFEVCWIGGNSL